MIVFNVVAYFEGEKSGADSSPERPLRVPRETPCVAEGAELSPYWAMAAQRGRFVIGGDKAGEWARGTAVGAKRRAVHGPPFFSDRTRGATSEQRGFDFTYTDTEREGGC